MNTLTNKNSANSSSSGSSTMSSSNCSMDMPRQRGEQKQRNSASSRSRSFLHCLGKHLGRHFLHSHHSHHHHDANIYNSQDDIRSSSTDSFSLSFERASRTECHNIGGGGGGSSIDLASNSNSDENNTSRGSSTSENSRYSPACPLDGDELEAYERYSANHIYVEAMYRPALRQEDEDNENDELSSDEDAENNARACRTNAPAKTESTERSGSTATSKGLHLSRISISSSVLGRMFHHFSASASTRSLSCSSTPLRRVTDASSTKSKSKSETSKSNAKKSSSTSASTSSKKKEKKQQQSILRPPVHYVYMKGMSGLYSRVPRYTVCCPYAMQQVS